jgi:hypothetical protein
MFESTRLSATGKLNRQELAFVRTPSPNFINRIVNGDCLTILPQLAAGSVDFVLTDPPYLVRYRDRSDRTVLNDDHDRWLVPAFAEIYRVLKPDRFCVSFYGWSQVDPILRRLAGCWISGRRPLGLAEALRLRATLSRIPPRTSVSACQKEPTAPDYADS